MKSRRNILLAIGFMLLLTGIWWSQVIREPRHEGKPVSYWLQLLYQGQQADKERARAALRELSPEVVPYLVRKMSREDSWIKRGYQKARHLSPAMGRALPPTYDGLQLRGYIYRFLRSLPSDELQTGLPEMIRLLDEPSPNLRAHTAVLISRSGPQATNAVEAMIHSLRYDSAYAASVNALGGMGRSAIPALPILKEGVTHSNVCYVLPALRSLAAIDRDDGELPELLLPLTQHASLLVRRQAVEELEELGWRAEPVLEALRETYRTESNKSLQRRIESAIKRIASSSEAKRRYEARLKAESEGQK